MKRSVVSVSCVVSVFNAESYIERCLKSILVQSYSFEKVVIYNDASTDGTLEKIKAVATNSPVSMKIIDSKINRGPGGGKNYAVKYVDTEYFMFLDADDYLDSNYLDILMKELLNCGNILPDILFADFKSVDLHGNIRYRRSYKDADGALYGNVSNWGKLFKKTFWMKHFLEIPDGKVLDDVLLRAYIVACAPIVKYTSKTCGYNYVSNPESVSNTYMNSFTKGVGTKEFLYLYQQYKKVTLEKREEYIYWVYKIYCWHMLKSGSGVGIKAMREEYALLNHKLKKMFPQYRSNQYLSGKKSLS